MKDINKKGFTLVELSIVLVIIGLLIGGILVGQSLINNAKLKRAMSELIQYQIMIKQFGEKFKGMPGDIDGYKYWGAACGQPWANLSTGNSGCNGNQDGEVTYAGEVALMWRHMYFGGYIDTLVSQNWNGGAPSFVAGVNTISAEIFAKDAIYWPEHGSNLDNTLIRITRANPTIHDQPTTAAIPGEMIAAIDAKYDDSIANSGNVFGGNGGYGDGYFANNCLANATQYNFNVTPNLDSGCVMWVRFIAY